MLTISTPLTPVEIILGKQARSHIDYTTLSEEDKIDFYRYGPEDKIPVLPPHGLKQEDILKYNIEITGYKIIHEEMFGASCREVLLKKPLSRNKKDTIIDKIKKYLFSDILENGIPAVNIKHHSYTLHDSVKSEVLLVNYCDIVAAYDQYCGHDSPQCLIPVAPVHPSMGGTKLHRLDRELITNIYTHVQNEYLTILQDKLELIDLVDLTNPDNLRPFWHVLYGRVSWTSPVERFKI